MPRIQETWRASLERSARQLSGVNGSPQARILDKLIRPDCQDGLYLMEWDDDIAILYASSREGQAAARIEYRVQKTVRAQRDVTQVFRALARRIDA